MSNQGTGLQEQWRTRSSQWEQRASEAGLSGVFVSLRHALMPLGPLAAQLLWVAQPTLGLFGKAESIGELAQLLEHPMTHHDADPCTSQDARP
jgi:hypothetical protein